MIENLNVPTADRAKILAAADAAQRAIPPAWPLASSVAVNPFLGQSGDGLAEVAALLARVAGVAVTMPRNWYADRIASGAITDSDLADALAACANPGLSIAALKAAAFRPAPSSHALPTVANLTARASGTDWPGLIAERSGAWAADFFDEGQALWAAPHGPGAYAAWRAVASRDLTPEIAGLAGFARHVAHAPQCARDAIVRAATRLGVSADAAPTYFHRLLMTVGGWAQYARYRLWQAELGGATDATATDLLAIALLWEEALFDRFEDRIASEWRAVLADHAAPIVPTRDQTIDAILQEASERAAQRGLGATLAAPAAPVQDARSALQAVFCIDVRSEVFRRALETVDPAIRTLGFAGFFGFTTSHHRLASDVPELRLPVLLNPSFDSRAGGPGTAATDRSARFKARAERAWGRFKLAAVSSFAFVEATGPVYAWKLLRDSLGLREVAAPDDPAPVLDPSPDLPARVNAAASVLRAMSLTQGFARLVLIAGHGANAVNNPHLSALHCGACGGYSGEVNAQLLAALLNDMHVRAGLAAEGIAVPADTLFVGALHDTTTDAVTLYAEDCPSPAHAPDVLQGRAWLAAAGTIARTERALRLPRAITPTDIGRRARDWAEVRPEWGLAGCSAFIAAPRARTAGKALGGRAFLHDYDWRADAGFGILELILTAPVVVASWISLQYYGSVVASDVFGGGNKLLHNVTGGIGVLEGNGGALRVGLPWQSVHDGEGFVHEPLRLSVCVEAPCEAITAILERHAGVRALFDNRWLHLFALDEAGHVASRYAGGLDWQAVRNCRDTSSTRVAA